MLIEIVPENQEEKDKRKQIEAALNNPSTTLDKWRHFAKSEYGLINGKLTLNYVFSNLCNAIT
jgi:hypothetical protein